MKKVVMSIVSVVIIMASSCKSKGGGSTPTAAIKAMAEEVKGGDFKAISKFLCEKDRKAMESMMPMMEAAAKMMGKDIKEMVKEQMAKDDQFNLSNVEFKNEKITGDNATLDIVNKKEGKTETVNFIKESGTWKMCPDIAAKTGEAMKSAGMGADGTNPMEKLNRPEMQEQMKKAADAMKNMTPEQMKQVQEAMKNVTPEQMKQMQEAMKNVTPEQIKQMEEAMKNMKQ
jgi:hypothetical protein